MLTNRTLNTDLGCDNNTTFKILCFSDEYKKYDTTEVEKSFEMIYHDLRVKLCILAEFCRLSGATLSPNANLT